MTTTYRHAKVATHHNETADMTNGKFTAEDARLVTASAKDRELCERIETAIRNRSASEIAINGNSARMRVWADDWFAKTLIEEMAARGFTVDPDFTIFVKADVWFSWEPQA